MKKENVNLSVSVEYSKSFKYEGKKTIKAQPMNRLDYNLLRGWELPKDENGSDEGYLVEYLDSPNKNTDFSDYYVSWSPKNVFERAYKVSETYMDRLIIEYDDLKEKIDKLKAFLERPDFDDIVGEEEAPLIRKQYKIMDEYLYVLRIRKEGVPF